MLILQRARNQAIRIGDHIVVRVIQTSKGLVRLGIDAPPEVPIIREELMDGGTADGAAHGGTPRRAA